jgi:hypothetical protein
MDKACVFRHEKTAVEAGLDRFAGGLHSGRESLIMSISSIDFLKSLVRAVRFDFGRLVPNGR